jgi:transposase
MRGRMNNQEWSSLGPLRRAARYDKTAASYHGFINLVSTRLWLREFVNTP